MALSAWSLYAFTAVALLAAALLHYRRHEPPGRGRYLLAILRGSSLALLVLLVFDPVLPDWRTARAPMVALVDGSLSMRLPGTDGTTRWEEAREVLAQLRPDRILVFGAGESRAVSSLEQARPDQPASRLGPALRSALEAGVGRVVVVTDGAVQDGTEVGLLAREHSGRVEIRRVGGETDGNVGLVELDAPTFSRVGEEVEVRLGIGRIGRVVQDSITVALRLDGLEVDRTRVSRPPEGSISAATLRFTPRSGVDGYLRLDASVEESDAEPADDGRSVYVLVAEESAGLVLVSFAPDQEPRFLLPVLERVVGLPAAGWLAPGPGRFVRLGVGPEAGAVASEAEVRRSVMEAELVVLHGIGEMAPEWARAAAATAERVLLFPGVGVEGLPLTLEPPQQGEWYPAADVPASPAASLIAAAGPAQAPPLTALRGARAPRGWWAPLHALQERRGEARPVLMAGRVGDRRVAIALADGYWRWAFAEDHGRALYEALWAGVAGWLMEDAGARGQDAVRPRTRVVPRGQHLGWLVPEEADSVRVILHPLSAPGEDPSVAGGVTEPAGGPSASEESAMPLDTVLVATDGAAVQARPRAGHYRYQAQAYIAGGGTASGAGELTIERYSSEFTRSALPLDPAPGGVGTVDAPDMGPGRPLRASPWPWAAVVVLLCAEWALRRRWGLR